MRESFKYLILFIPYLFSKVFPFLYCLHQLLSLVQVIGATAFTFKCFEEHPQVVASKLGEFQQRQNKGKIFEVVLQKAINTGLNNQPQFFENKIHFSLFGSGNIYLEYGLLSSKMLLTGK